MSITNSGYSLQVTNWESGAVPYRCVTPPGN